MKESAGSPVELAIFDETEELDDYMQVDVLHLLCSGCEQQMAEFEKVSRKLSWESESYVSQWLKVIFYGERFNGQCKYQNVST